MFASLKFMNLVLSVYSPANTIILVMHRNILGTLRSWNSHVVAARFNHALTVWEI